MNIEFYPESKLAARLVNIKNLTIPIDIFSIAEQYAYIDLLDIPFEIDGISLNLKTEGKRPRLLVKKLNSNEKIRLIIAHGLGHILIPWHIGSIVDKTLLPNEIKFDKYWKLEEEANRFAYELLMPSIWVRYIIESNQYDLQKITNQLVEMANVSPHDATLKIKDIIRPGYMFAALTEYGEVLFSGKSEGTLAVPPICGKEIIAEELFPFCEKRFQFQINEFYYYWWFFDEKIPIPNSASIGDWKELLSEIVFETGVRSSDHDNFKRSLNSDIVYANSQVRGDSRTPESLYAAVLQRLHGRPEYKKIIDHPKFNSFIYSKIDSLVNRQTTSQCMDLSK